MLDPTEPDEEMEYLVRTYGALEKVLSPLGKPDPEAPHFEWRCLHAAYPICAECFDPWLERQREAKGSSDASGASRKPDQEGGLYHPTDPPSDPATDSLLEPLEARQYAVETPEMTVAVRRAMLLADLERTLALLRALEDEA